MTPLEWLVVLMGVPFFFIELSQLIQLVRSQKRLTAIWEKFLEDREYAGEVGANILLGLMDKIATDKEAQETFFGFVQVCSINAVTGIREHFTGQGEAGIKLKKSSQLKPFEGILNQVLPGLLDKVVKGAQNKAVDGAAEAVLEGW